MNEAIKDLRLITGLSLVHLLIFFTFLNSAIFWHIFSAAMLLLITYSILNEEFDRQLPFHKYFIIGVISGVGLYLVFLSGNELIERINLPLKYQIERLYNHYSPKMGWHNFVLYLIIIPGEEIFWRGFIQKRISKYLSFWTSIFISAILYASIQFYSGSIILPIAALISGVFWGFLYERMKSIHLVIVSHLVFDLLLFVFFPLL